MPEIKTCEEYVLMELSNAFERINYLTNTYTELSNKYNELNNNYNLLKDTIKKLAGIRKSLSGYKYIKFIDPYEDYDAEEYSTLLGLIPDLPVLEDSDKNL